MGSLKVTGLLGGNFVGNLHVSGKIETASVDTNANINNKMFVMKWYARNIQTKPKPPSPPTPLKKPKNLENFRVTCFISTIYINLKKKNC